MKKLTQKLWAIKFVGDEYSKPNFKLDGFELTKKDCERKLKIAYNHPGFKVVRVTIKEE